MFVWFFSILLTDVIRGGQQQDWKFAQAGVRFDVPTHQWQYLVETTEDGKAGPKHPLPNMEFKVGMKFWVNEFDSRAQYAKKRGWMERAKEELKESNPALYELYLGNNLESQQWAYVWFVLDFQSKRLRQSACHSYEDNWKPFFHSVSTGFVSLFVHEDYE